MMKFLTQLNSGCIDICKNMLKSAENVGLSMEDFYIACLDQNAFEHMKEYPGVFLYRDQPITEYQNWSFDAQSNFREIVRTKWKLISDIHEQVHELCWVDTDIVFIKNPVAMISNHKQILFQSDSPGSALCTGFMVFNGTDECKKLISECADNEEEDDQIIANIIALTKFNDHVGILTPELFPNGHVYHALNVKQNAVIVHNNHMVGIETKINKFKEEGLWYVKSENSRDVSSQFQTQTQN